MQHSDDNIFKQLTPLEKMLRVLEELLQLREHKSQPSIAAKISKKLTELQTIYHAFDDDTRNAIHDLLKENNLALLNALEKKGSKIIKPLELAGHIKDSLPDEIKLAIKTNPKLTSMKTSAIPSHDQTESEYVVADTVRIRDEDSVEPQLKDALASASRQLDPNIYALFAAPDADAEPAKSPLAAIISALEILHKTKLAKDKIMQGEPKPNGFDNVYRETLLKQFNILKMNKHILADISLDGANQKKLDEIKLKLGDTSATKVPAILVLAGSISAMIDKNMLVNLRDTINTQQTSTPKKSK